MTDDRIAAIRWRCDMATPDGIELLDNRTKNLTDGLLGMQENGTMQASKTFLHTIRAYMVELLECRRDEIPFLLTEIDRLNSELLQKTQQLSDLKDSGFAEAVRVATRRMTRTGQLGATIGHGAARRKGESEDVSLLQC